MKKEVLLKSVLVVVAVVSFCGLSSAQSFEFTDEREMAKSVLKSLQAEDVELFSTYCISENRLSKMLDEMGSTTEKEKSIKSELSEIPASELKEEAITGFHKALELAKRDDIDLKDAVYPELAFYKTRFEVTNLKCVKVKADISIGKNYMIIINMFHTPDDLFIYSFELIEGGMY